MPGPGPAPRPRSAVTTSSGLGRSGHLTVGRPIIASPLCCRCQLAGRGFFDAAGGCRGGRWWARFGWLGARPGVAPGRMVVAGPGVGWPKSRRAGCNPAALETERFPGCPPGPLGQAAAACRASCCRRRVDRVADPPPERPRRFLVRLALGRFLVVAGPALAVLMPIWLIAARWIAWLGLRLPRSGSRQSVRPPEDTSAGAVPWQAAKWSRPGNRNTRRTSPVTVPAMTGAAPDRPVRRAPGARAAAAGSLPVPRSRASRRPMPVRNPAASSQRARVTAPDGVTRPRMRAARAAGISSW